MEGRRSEVRIQQANFTAHLPGYRLASACAEYAAAIVVLKSGEHHDVRPGPVLRQEEDPLNEFGDLLACQPIKCWGNIVAILVHPRFPGVLECFTLFPYPLHLLNIAAHWLSAGAVIGSFFLESIGSQIR